MSTTFRNVIESYRDNNDTAESHLLSSQTLHPPPLSLSLTTDARSLDPARQLKGTSCIRRLLAKESEPPIEAVVKSNIMGRLVEILATATTNPTLQFEAVWAITNVASTEYTRHVVDAGAIGPLVAGMMSADATLRDQCIWCIGNIAGDCAKYRDAILGTAGALQALLLNIQNPSSVELLRNATWTLSNFCRGKPTPAPELVAAVLPALAYLLSQTDRDVLVDAAWGISYLTDGNEATVQSVLNSGIAVRCVELMGHSDITVVTPALRIVGNFISGSDVQTTAALTAGALTALVPLLAHTRRNIKREACWAISNVAAGTRDQLSALFTTQGVIPAVIALLGGHERENNDWNVRKEAVWVVSNIASVGAPEHVSMLVAGGTIEPLVDILSSTHDPRMMSVVLDAVEGILRAAAAAAPGRRETSDKFEEAGLLEALETVQATASDDVYAKAVTIIETYYGTTDEEEEESVETQFYDHLSHAPAAQVNASPFGALATVAARANTMTHTGVDSTACFGSSRSTGLGVSNFTDFSTMQFA